MTTQDDTKMIIKDSDTENFITDVIKASQEAIVVTYFWAPRCKSCVILSPILEKLAREMHENIQLVKIDIDKNPEIATQFDLHVQSIPTVYAFKNGQPVDNFSGTLSEEEICNFLQKLISSGKHLPPPISTSKTLNQAQDKLDAGNPEEAGAIFQSILSEDSSQVLAVAGLLRCLLALDKINEARQIIEHVSKDMVDHPAIGAVQTALELRDTPPLDNDTIDSLRQEIRNNPDDHKTRFELAMMLYGAGQENTAVDELLELFRRDPNWNNEAAKTQLLKFFEALGFTHPISIEGHLRLSSMTVT